MTEFVASNGWRVTPLNADQVKLSRALPNDSREYVIWIAGDEFQALREFFAAHPEPKPWHDAKDGEVWSLGVGGGYDAYSVAVTGGKFVHGVRDGLRVWEIDDPQIDYGKRIWPDAS